jgi:hypothetical protein
MRFLTFHRTFVLGKYTLSIIADQLPADDKNVIIADIRFHWLIYGIYGEGTL